MLVIIFRRRCGVCWADDIGTFFCAFCVAGDTLAQWCSGWNVHCDSPNDSHPDCAKVPKISLCAYEDQTVWTGGPPFKWNNQCENGYVRIQ